MLTMIEIKVTKSIDNRKNITISLMISLGKYSLKIVYTIDVFWESFAILLCF